MCVSEPMVRDEQTPVWVAKHSVNHGVRDEQTPVWV